MKTIAFAKMVASGNDFVVIDGRSKSCVPGSKLGEFAKEVCDRKYGIGADGLLVIEKSKKAALKMRIFNPDGSEPGMCGNGARCAAMYCAKGTKRVRFETKAGIIEAEVKKDIVKLKMTDPKDLWANIDLNVGSQFCKVHYINSGVPHAVFFAGNVDTINVKDVGKQIRLHRQFQPNGTNANFAQVVDDKTIKIRTYERGVEDETLACGTGSVASALLSHHLKLTSRIPVSVETRGGEVLKVYFDYKKDRFSNVWLEGGARIVFSGEYAGPP